MAKTSREYRCGGCGAGAPRWTGRCGRCGEFGTVTETRRSGSSVGRSSVTAPDPSRAAHPITALTRARPEVRITTGVAEFDRVLGGGLVSGQVLLLTGEPGAGKSTLLLTIADSVAELTRRRVLYVSAEESGDQIAVRARRIGVTSDLLYVADDTDLPTVLGHMEEHRESLSLVIVDSVQTVSSPDVDGRAGGVSQVMEVARALTRAAKTTGIPLCLVGHVTKESTVAGPRALEHTVDTTLTLDGDRHTTLRLLRAVKNRYGPTDEVACFEQTDSGIREVPDPSSLFLRTRDEPVPGTCVTVAVEGRRAVLAEVQALVAPTTNPNPRRGVTGLDSARAAMLLAVTERITRQRLFDHDVFTATLGGMRLVDPGADLAICLSIASARMNFALPTDLAAVGEVTLSGEIRPVPMVAQRIGEALRLGFRRILAPPGTQSRLDGSARSAVLEASDLRYALLQLE